MLTDGDRSRHSTQVLAAAEAAVAAFATDADPDRRDLAALLGAVGAAWASSAEYPTSLAEAFRWSEVCVIAERVSRRFMLEMALIESDETPPEPLDSGKVIPLSRIRRGT